MILTGVRNLPGEEWRPVIGFEETYLVSSLGRFCSMPRPHTSGGLLHVTVDKASGYHGVHLSLKSQVRTLRVHVLMAEAFLPRPESATVVRHLDDNKDNNQLSNLAWGSQSDNGHDCVANGNHHWASKTSCIRNHEFTPENTYVSGTGRRSCRACRRDRHLAGSDAATIRAWAASTGVACPTTGRLPKSVRLAYWASLEVAS